MMEITFGYRKDFYPNKPNHPDSPTIKCRELSIDTCGNILVDSELRGTIDTAHNNFIFFDGKDICGDTLVIKETNDSSEV